MIRYQILCIPRCMKELTFTKLSISFVSSFAAAYIWPFRVCAQSVDVATVGLWWFTFVDICKNRATFGTYKYYSAFLGIPWKCLTYHVVGSKYELMFARPVQLFSDFWYPSRHWHSKVPFKLIHSAPVPHSAVPAVHSSTSEIRRIFFTPYIYIDGQPQSWKAEWI